MNGLLKYLTGKATAPLNMLVALGFAVFAFVGLPLEATETTPTNGLPDSAESVQVAKIQENFDVVEGSAAFNTLSRALAETWDFPFRARETVAVETPAR